MVELSIPKLWSGVFEVKSTGNVNHTGGEDFGIVASAAWSFGPGIL
jgi:molecular chaperone DnaK (HSP70)